MSYIATSCDVNSENILHMKQDCELLWSWVSESEGDMWDDQAMGGCVFTTDPSCDHMNSVNFKT